MVVRVPAGCLVLFVALFFAISAKADWSASGLQFHCDADQSRFEIVPRNQTSDGDDPIFPGFAVAEDGVSQHRCKLGKHTLVAEFDIIGPQASGACMGGGLARIESLSVDGLELEDEPIYINWVCADSDDPSVLQVKVDAGPAGVALAKCTAADDAGSTRNALRCLTKVINVDAQVAALGKIDHDLADPATQAAQSATKIPADNDMAQVFAGQTDPSGAPACAHWQERFGWLPDPSQPWGRISGAPQQEAPVFPVYPQLCTRKSDSACDSSGSLLAGDRVEIGFVCGAWTQVGYHPRLRGRSSMTGWVETARIYGIQPLLPPDPPITYWVRTTEPLWQQPLIAAVLKDDTEAITDLLRNDADPNVAVGRVTPLSVAIWWDRRTAIEALLAAGARVESTALMQVAAMRSERRRFALDPSRAPNPMRLAKLLLQHGATVDATDEKGSTALFSAVRANNVDIAAFLLDAGADPNKTRGVRESGATETASYDGYTPLMVAVSTYFTTADPSMIRLLLAHGTDPNFIADKAHYDSEGGFAGETVLTYAAARYDNKTVITDLLEGGADPTLPRADGALPADIARDAGFPKVAALIAEAAKNKQP
jgi:ankyrin repeat protein